MMRLGLLFTAHLIINLIGKLGSIYMEGICNLDLLRIALIEKEHLDGKKIRKLIFSENIKETRISILK